MYALSCMHTSSAGAIPVTSPFTFFASHPSLPPLPLLLFSPPLSLAHSLLHLSPSFSYPSTTFLLQLWEQEGLDLALIPYGCIATGPDTGFIEVVKNARTIAEVRTVASSGTTHSIHTNMHVQQIIGSLLLYLVSYVHL